MIIFDHIISSSLVRIFIVSLLCSTAYSLSPLEKYYYTDDQFQLFTGDTILRGKPFLNLNYKICDGKALGLTNILIKPSINFEDTFDFRLDGGVTAVINDKIQFHWNYRISDNYDLLPGSTVRKRQSFRDITGDLVYAAINLKGENVFLSLNRGRFETSRYGENLLINANENIPENIIIAFFNRTFTVENALMFLNSASYKRKVIAYHRYGMTPLKQLQFGFSEVAIMAFDQYNIDVYRYLVPYSFYYEAEANSSQNISNLMWRFDVSFVTQRAEFWGEFLIDDYALDGLTPPKLGLLAGMRTDVQSIPLIVKYVKINRWVYNYGFDMPELRFVNGLDPIGNDLGPDAMKIEVSTHLSFQHENQTQLDLFPKFALIGNGDGDIFENTPVQSGQSFGYSKQKYLTGDAVYQLNCELFAIVNFGSTTGKIILSNYQNTSVFRLILEYRIL